VNKVGSELNNLHRKFLTRNKDFKGNVSVIGHSLGSLILFDLLTHQVSDEQTADQFENVRKTSAQSNDIQLEAFLANLGLQEYLDNFEREKIDASNFV
jgi:hypothetical protein